ncbi:MAG: TonB-dependent receptor [Omnitrophica WOR_2 bacterium]|jgi:outer membrane receptor protein involved in Fe transport
MNKKILFLLSICLMLTIAVSAQYQVPSYDSSEIKKIDLNEIVVKSTRENSVMIKNLAASISLMKAKTIEDNGISSLKDLVGYVPNFFMPDYGSRLTSPVYIRGIGSRINSPSIGLYVDNVPYFEKSAFDFEFNDIDRIEVLRGPQGTSYGRNTMGGLIKVYTKDPTEKRETKLSLTGGNYGLFRADVSNSQSIGANSGLSVSAFYGRNSGYFTNEFENTPVDKDKYFGGRIKLVHNAGENTKLQFTSGFEHSDQGGYPYAKIDIKTGEISPVNYDFYSSYKRDILSNSFVVDHSSNDLVFQSVTSHQYLKDDQNIDQDFTPASLFYVNQNTYQNMFSQEFTLKNKPGHKISWVAGAFGFLQYIQDNVNVTYGPDGIVQYKLPGEASRIKNYDNVIKGAALFGESSINNLFTKGLTLTAGIRLDYEEAIQDYLYNTFTAGVQKTVDDSRGLVNYSEILPKASLSYNMSKHISAYTTVAKGYKTGGFNTTFETQQDRSFKPEYSWNYEVGVKTIFLDKALLTNVSAFYIDWKDQQIYQPVPSGQGSMLKNAGHSVSKGIEAEIIAKPCRNVSLFTSYGLTEAKFTEYQRTAEVNYKGNYIPYAPGNTFQVGADYSVPVNTKALNKITINANYQGQGKIYWNEENTASQKFYGIVNGRISFQSKIARIDLWAKNILNEKYNSFYFTSLGKSFVQVGKPAQFGANLIFNF